MDWINANHGTVDNHRKRDTSHAGKTFVFFIVPCTQKKTGSFLHGCEHLDFSVCVPLAFQLWFYQCPEVVMLPWEPLGVRLPFHYFFFSKFRKPMVSDPAYALICVFSVPPSLVPGLQGPEGLHLGTT